MKTTCMLCGAEIAAGEGEKRPQDQFAMVSLKQAEHMLAQHQDKMTADVLPVSGQFTTVGASTFFRSDDPHFAEIQREATFAAMEAYLIRVIKGAVTAAVTRPR